MQLTRNELKKLVHQSGEGIVHNDDYEQPERVIRTHDSSCSDSSALDRLRCGGGSDHLASSVSNDSEAFSMIR